jgi:anti-sigma-K factor RskA
MNRELLERLAIDHAVGAMPPDTEQLFSECLRTDPQAAELVRSLEQTLALARDVTKGKAPHSLPAFPQSDLERAEIWHRRARKMVGIGALAACLAIGLGLGRLSAPTAAKPGALSPVVVLKAGQEPARAAGSEPGFWSVQRFRERSTPEVPGRSRPLIWHSPVAAPRLGGPT